jgi:hypothetical protein
MILGVIKTQKKITPKSTAIRIAAMFLRPFIFCSQLSHSFLLKLYIPIIPQTNVSSHITKTYTKEIPKSLGFGFSAYLKVIMISTSLIMLNASIAS